MKRKLVSLCLIFTFLFTTCTVLEFTSVNTYALVKKKIQKKGKNKVVWKNYTNDSYLEALKEDGWYNDNPSPYYKYVVRNQDEITEYGGSITIAMGKLWGGEKTNELISVDTCLSKKDVSYRKALKKALTYIIPDGAKEIVNFVYKNHRNYKGECYIFHNINGTTVVIYDLNGRTKIDIFNKPYMTKKDLDGKIIYNFD